MLFTLMLYIQVHVHPKCHRYTSFSMFHGCTHNLLTGGPPPTDPCQDFQWSDSSLDYNLCVWDKVGGGHSGRGRCSPSMSGVSWGLWVALVGIQSPSEAWAALR